MRVLDAGLVECWPFYVAKVTSGFREQKRRESMSFAF
jgi:hypothetical protein